jgi:translation initiation factor 1A
VTRILGNGIMEGQCFDGKKRKCIIRGCMGRRKWVNIGDVVLVCLREFEDDKCDIVHKFYPDEVKTLKAKNELPDSVLVNENTETAEDNDIHFIDDEGNDVELVQNTN